MTSKRNLGPIFALTGAGIAIAAVIAGFIAVGGPGDARDRRFDDITFSKLNAVIGIAQCAFETTGEAPANFEAAKATPNSSENKAFPLCESNDARGIAVTSGSQPANPGDMTYERLAPAQIRACGHFRAPFDVNHAGYTAGLTYLYPQLDEPAPAGVRCYVIDLIKNPNSTEPVADVVITQ